MVASLIHVGVQGRSASHDRLLYHSSQVYSRILACRVYALRISSTISVFYTLGDKTCRCCADLPRVYHARGGFPNLEADQPAGEVSCDKTVDMTLPGDWWWEFNGGGTYLICQKAW